MPIINNNVEKDKLNIEEMVAEFDEQYRIVHQTADRPLYFRTMEEGELLARATDKNLSRFLGNERGYLVTNISRIVIDPAVVDLYAERINTFLARYLQPHGIARYGYAIGRVTVRMAHESNRLEDLNMFATKEEAFAFIRGLEVRRLELEQAFAKVR